jgi:uncharacterized protein (TIGR02217 family)
MAFVGFIETPTLPDETSFWAVGGRSWQTTVVQTYGGDEYRNAAWSRRLGRWTLSEALRSTNPLSSHYLGTVLEMHTLAFGRLGGFRMRDWQDYKDNDGMKTGTAAGTWLAIDATHWQMYKTYTLSPNSYVQIIQKPRTGIVIGGHSGGTLDLTTGILTGGSGGTPSGWTGTYDVPVRFDSDIPDVGMLAEGTYYNWNSLNVVELKNLS